MRAFFKGLMGSLVVWWFRKYRYLSLDLLKIHAAMWYLQGVRTVRKVFLGILALALCLTLGSTGFLLFHIGLFALLPPPYNAIVLMALGAIYMLMALLVIHWLASEKAWMKLTSAARFAEMAAKKHDS